MGGGNWHPGRPANAQRPMAAAADRRLCEFDIGNSLSWAGL
jgi:hypothetical protein